MFVCFFFLNFLTRSLISVQVTSTKAFICLVSYAFRSAALDTFLLDSRCTRPPQSICITYGKWGQSGFSSVGPLQPPSWTRERLHQWLSTAGFMARIDGPKAMDHRW